MTHRPFSSVLLFGAPGVGKGTQGKILGKIPGFFHLSAGDVFRSIDISSVEGKEVYEFISRGELVPDDLTIQIWKRALHAYVTLSWYKPWEDLLVLDGLPRNVNQCKLVEDQLEILQLIHLECSDEEDMIHRVKRRAIRENRADDANEDVIRYRFEVYNQISRPLLDYYPNEQIYTVDANGSPAEVLQRTLECLIPAQNEHFRRVRDANDTP